MPKETKESAKEEQKSYFRTDIAGLRGIAVLLVVLCHFQIPGFSGGFIGPDVFFVISGYLITGLLVKEYDASIIARSRGITKTGQLGASTSKRRRGKISITSFYLRRARRILPASIFVLIAINLYAVINLNILQIGAIRSDSIWTLLFAANIHFLHQSTDYFAQGASVSPVLHYWSLSVEEQFYFLWPVLFIAATRINNLKVFGRKINWRSRVGYAVGALGVFSFIWMANEFDPSFPSTAYFSTFSRAWELAFGGALAVAAVPTFSSWITRHLAKIRLAALAVLLGSIAVASPQNFGYTLWIPVVATGFLLWTGSTARGDLAYSVLSVNPLLSVGAISYSLYLWHWPIFVFGKDLGLMDTLSQRIFGILACLLLATCSYVLIEQKFLKIYRFQQARRKGSSERIT